MCEITEIDEKKDFENGLIKEHLIPKYNVFNL